MVNVYLSGADARNAAADLWQSDQLKRLNDQFAPPPADTAQPLPSAPVEAAGVQGSSLPSPPAVGPAMTQPAPPAAVPAPAPVLPAAPNPTPDRNDLADHFTRNAIADAWEQNALADVTKGVSQAGAGVQSALADVPKEAQGLVSNYSALPPGAQPPPPAQPAPGAISGIPAPQPTQAQTATVAGGGDLQSYARQAAQRNGVDPDIFQRQIQQESGFRTDAVSPAGATGIAQFMPATARGMGVDPSDPYASLDGAARLMKQNLDRYGGDYSRALAAYNAGPGNVDKYGGVPPFEETQRYVKTILSGAGDFAHQAASGAGQAVQSVASTVGGAAQPISRPADDWLAIAKEQLGKPYIWGSAGGRSTFDPSAPGFDCSGFVSYVMKKAFNVDLPAFTGTAYTATRPLQEGETPGAAGQVAFYNMGQSDPHLQHIALSIGDGKVIQAGGRRNDVNTDVANDIGTPEWRVPVGIPGKLADAAQQVVGAGAAAAQAGQNVQQAVQQTAQGLIGTVGNVGSAIGTTASNVASALTSPNLPSQIYQNSPIGAFNTATQQIGQNVVSPALEAITQPGGALIGPRTAAAGVLENAASNVPSGVPVVGGALQAVANTIGGPTVIDQIGMVQDLANKYPSAVPGLPDVNRMTPQDQAQWSNLMIGVGGITGGEGAGGESLAQKAGSLEAQARPPAQQFTAEGAEVPPSAVTPPAAPPPEPPPPPTTPSVPEPAPTAPEPPAGPTVQPVSFNEAFRQYHVGNVISGPATMTHVIVNSLLSPAWSLATRGAADVAGGLAGMATGGQVGLDTGMARVAGRGVGALSALSQMGGDFAGAIREFYTNPTNIANRVDNPLVAGFFRAQQATGAALHASFQTMAQGMVQRLEQSAMAGEEATRQGLTPLSGAWRNKVADLMNSPTPEMVSKATDVGQRAALRAPAGYLQDVMQNVAKIPYLGNGLFPVVRIASQSLAQGIEKSPAGLVGTGFDVARGLAGKGPYAEGFNQLGGAVTPLGDRLTNNLAGTALTLWLIQKAQDGTITGAGPQDPRQRQTLQSQGWQPNSLFIPGRGYVDYRFLGPLAIPMALAGAWHDAQNYGKPMQSGVSDTDRAGEFAGQLARQVGTYLVSHTGLQTLADLAGAMQGDPQALANWPGNLASGFVPMSAAVRGVANATDPYLRRNQAGDIGQIISAGIPGLREGLPVRQDVLGQPEANPQAGLGVFSPRTGTGAPSPLLTMLSQAGINLSSTPPKDISYSGRQIALTPDEQQQRQTLFGQRLQQTMQGYLKSQKFQALPPDQQFKALEPVVRAASQYADQRVIAEMPAADRRARMTSAPRAYGAGVVPYVAAGGGLASLVARQSAADADAAHQRLLAGYATQPQVVGAPTQ